MENCKFCEIYSEKKFDFENELAFAFWDANPVSKGHIIFMTKRHIERNTGSGGGGGGGHHTSSRGVSHGGGGHRR